jgi:hypothetical protein
MSTPCLTGSVIPCLLLTLLFISAVLVLRAVVDSALEADYLEPDLDDDWEDRPLR